MRRVLATLGLLAIGLTSQEVGAVYMEIDSTRITINEVENYIACYDWTGIKHTKYRISLSEKELNKVNGDHEMALDYFVNFLFVGDYVKLNTDPSLVRKTLKDQNQNFEFGDPAFLYLNVTEEEEGTDCQV
jgi:hypothetical protein